MQQAARLRELLKAGKLVVAPGCYDGITARAVERAGFPALYMTGAGTAATTGSNDVYLGGGPLVVLGPEHARTFADSGWSKADVKRVIWERARVRLDRFSPENRERLGVLDPERFRGRLLAEEVALCASPDDLMVIVAGGPGKHSAIIPTFGATRSVTVAIAR